MKLCTCAFTLLCLGLLLVCLEAAAPSSSSKKNRKAFTWKCDLKDEASIDSMAARAVIVGHSAEKFPENSKELKLICEKDFPRLTRMESYRDACTTGQTKQVLSVLLYSLRGMINQYCKVSSRKAKALIAGGACYNGAKGRLAQCMASAIENLSGVLEEPSKLKRRQMCCTYSDAVKCIARQLESAAAVCQERHIETLLVFFKAALENPFNVVCGDYAEDTDKCDAYPFVEKKRAQKAANKYKFESFFLPLLKIMQSL